MPKLKDTLGKVVKELYEIRGREEIDWKDGTEADVTTAYDYAKLQIQTLYKQNAIDHLITAEIKKLPEAKQKELFKDLKGPGGNQYNTEKDFMEKCKSKSASTTMRLFDKEYWGTPNDSHVLEVLDKHLSEEQRNRIYEAAKEIKTPDDPSYTGKTDDEPYKEKIEELKKKAALENPFAAESTARFLDGVNKHLTRVDPDFREYFNQIDGLQGKNDMTKATDWTFTHIYKRGVQELAGGQFKDVMKIPELKKDNKRTEGYTLMAQDDNQANRKLTEQEIASLKTMKSPLSEEAIEGIEDVVKEFDSPVYENEFTARESNGDMKLYPGHKKGDKIFLPELGQKYYAFLPLANAQEKLEKAVESGDMDAIRKADEEYVKMENKLTRMMGKIKDPKNNHGMLFDGNVNPTRSSTSRMPSVFIKDAVNATKLNSLYCANVMGKNANMDPMEFIKDPVNAPIKAHENYKKTNGINSREGVGAKLCWAMQAKRKGEDSTQHSNYKENYDNYIEFPRTRAQGALLNFEPDKKKREQFAALSTLGAYTAAQEARRERQRFNIMEEIAVGKKQRHYKEIEAMGKEAAEAADLRFSRDARGMRNAIYENAAILPSDKFNMEEIADTFLDPNPDAWRAKLSTAEMVKPENIYNLDLKELAKRPEEVIRQHEEEEIKDEIFQSHFNRDEFLISSFGVYSQILKNATADVRGTEDYRKLQETVRNMHTLTDDPSTKALLSAGAKTLDDPNFLNTLTTTKNDRTLKGDSGYYAAMKDSVNVVKQHVDAMMRVPKNPGDLALLNSGKSFASALDDAVFDTFDYVSSRTKFGTKTSFRAASGQARVNEGYQTLEKLYKLQDENGLRSPAQKMYEDARLELMKNRSNKAWMEQNGMEYVKRMVHSKRFMDAGIPNEDAKEAFKEENWNEFSSAVDNNKSFKNYIKGKKLDDIVGDALTDGKKFASLTKGMGKELKDFHQKQVVEPREAKKQADAKKNYAISLAKDAVAGSLNLNEIKVNDRNPKIQEGYQKIMEEPEFQAVVDRSLRVKKLDERPKPIPYNNQYDYIKTKQFLQYERKCAEICVEKLKAEELNKLGAEQRQEELKRQTDKLLKDPDFMDIMDEKLHDAYSSGVGYVEGQLKMLETQNGAQRVFNNITSEMEDRREAREEAEAQKQNNQPEAVNQAEKQGEKQGEELDQNVQPQIGGPF